MTGPKVVASTRANLIYDLISWFFNIILDIFFREIRPRGSHKIPHEGPVIFVAAPHANQFVDPLILMRECKRRVSFLIAEKSMHRKEIAFFAKSIQSIPVVRGQDVAKEGEGKIMLRDRIGAPTRIYGVGTAFTRQLHKGDQITLPDDAGSSEVVEIISNTEIVIKKEFKGLKALGLLDNADGTKYKCSPHINQDSVYKAVYEQLNRGGCIGIFPEGGSHDRSELMPLKAGVTIMALGAMAANPGLDVKIVPCGLNYFHPHKFRSRAVIEFGSPITIDPSLVTKFSEGGPSKREACGKLLDMIYNALRSVTVNAPDYEKLMVIQAGRRLYKPAHRKLHISQVVDLNRRFIHGYERYKDEPKVKELEQKVLAYNQLLKYHGLKDHQVDRTRVGGLWTFGLFCYRVSLLFFWGGLALPGFLLNLPVVIIARLISAKKAREALAASTVKLAGRDVLATWKLLVGLVFFPALYFFYAVVVFVISIHYNFPLKWKVLSPIITWNAMPFVSYASLRFGEAGLDVYRSLRPLFLALIPWTRHSVENLQTVRSKLSYDITDLINEYGPKVFPDFDSDRILNPTPPPPSSLSAQAGGLKRSRSAAALSSLFATPMDWLDDHVFNWAMADNEDADDIFFFLDKSNGGVSGRSYSNASSRASSRERSRSRTSSFKGHNTEGFKVERMTELPKNKTLDEVTRRIREGEFENGGPSFTVAQSDQVENKKAV